MQNRIPNPAELQKELKEFLSQKYGQEINVVIPEGQTAGSQEGQQTTEERPAQIDFDLKPEELEEYLNRFLIKQQDAKEILATKICTHFHRMKLENQEQGTPVGDIKNNIIMIGPTGVGKTYVIKLIAQKIGVPFVKGDATKFSETGYVGGDVEDLVRDLVTEAKGNIELAQYGIIYIDEIDKISTAGTIVGPDVSRTGVQRNLLKLMEETEVDLKAPHDMTAQMESMMQFQRTGKVERKKINTRNILFIVSGAFTGLEDIIGKRINKKPVGFTADAHTKKKDDNTEDLKQVKSEDLINYGFESEFIGRLPMVAVLEHLGEDDLYQILKNPNSPVIVGKKMDFKAYGIEIEFDDEALRSIAKKAIKEKTGARGLVSVCERALLKFEKRFPSTDVKYLRVTKEIVKDPDVEIEKLLNFDSIRKYKDDFSRENNIEIDFSKAAIGTILQKAREIGTDARTLCSDMLADYGHGLKLMDVDKFTVTPEVVTDPKAYMDNLIKEFYSNSKDK